MKALVVLSLAVACFGASVKQKQEKQRFFPKDFLFGTATASYQVEGAWNEDGKSENIWDHITHNNPNVIRDQSNGDIAADSYHKYKRDVEMMRELGLDAYRFSFSWTRILPTGFRNKVNSAGIEYYNNFLNEMLKYNIKPIATIYHWDLPQSLQVLGGWSNPLMVGWFEDYARVLYENFGDRVKHWITFNEPRELCYLGYGSNEMAPMLNATAVGTYICAKNLVLAHANAYHAYNNDYRATQGGECGITISVSWYEALTDSPEDVYTAELHRQANWGIYADPIFSSEGGFPKEFSERVAAKSAEQGFPWSRMPEFTEEEKAWVRGSSDFFGVNHYTGSLISASDRKSSWPVPSLQDDVSSGTTQPPEWPKGASYWLKLVPHSLYNALIQLTTRYNNPVFYVTENGWSTETSCLMDDDRIRYYRAALEDVLDALDAGVNLKGYMAWSLMDNFEWMQGYSHRFGLYHVDFEDPARTRTPRKSAFFYKNVIKNRYIDHNYEPDSMTMAIDEGH